MAFLRKQGQGVEIPGYQSGAGILGTGQQTGVAQPTTAAQPGGWTNIQDYLNANKGDMTNINTAKTKTAENIQKGAEEVAGQKADLKPLADPTAYSKDVLGQALDADDYGNVSEMLSQQDAMNQYQLLPDVSQEITGYAPLEQQMKDVTELDPTNFGKTMQFVGSLAPDSPNYSQGSKAFDSMLLQGSPEFRQGFVPNVQEQYKNLYQTPLEQARAAREAERTAGLGNIEQAQQDWRSGISGYLGEQDTAISNILAQQQAQEAQAGNLTFEEWQKMFDEYSTAQQADPNGGTVTSPVGSFTSPTDYLNYAQRTGNVAPSQETAAYEYGGANRADYNALVGLINQMYGEGRQQLNPVQGYNPGTWALKNIGV